MKKTYVIICGFIDVVAGGPIYNSNKVRYMKGLGWNVVVIPTHGGEKVYIRGMESYYGPHFPCIEDMPNEYSKKQRRHFVDILESYVPKGQDEIIVETGTDYTAYWGEALAERLHAKHIIIFLDEENKNIDEDVLDFYRFKYHRKELAGISRQTMHHIFGKQLGLELKDCNSLHCCCHNSVDDYEHPLTAQIEKADYNIGSVGRLEKKYVPNIIKGVLEFSDYVYPRKVSLTFFGGAYEKKTIQQIRECFRGKTNIKLVISDYLFPLPIKALQKMNVFVSAAGSVAAGLYANVPSIRMNIYTNEPQGLQLNTECTKFAFCPLGTSVADYLKWILIDKNFPKPEYADYTKTWEYICNRFDEHMKFIRNSSQVVEYYDLEKLKISKKRKYKRFFRTVLGLHLYNALHGKWALLLTWKNNWSI